METNQEVVATINNIEILVVDVNGQKRVPVKPICDALGIVSNSQIERIKNDPILGSTHMMSISVGADEKDRSMFTIPLMYTFGWLFRIDSMNVKEEARESVLKYQIECYKALYEYFEGVRKFLKEKEAFVEEGTARVKEAKRNFREAQKILKQTEDELYEGARVTYEQYKQQGFQLDLGLK